MLDTKTSLEQMKFAKQQIKTTSVNVYRSDFVSIGGMLSNLKVHEESATVVLLIMDEGSSKPRRVNLQASQKIQFEISAVEETERDVGIELDAPATPAPGSLRPEPGIATPITAVSEEVARAARLAAEAEREEDEKAGELDDSVEGDAVLPGAVLSPSSSAPGPSSSAPGPSLTDRAIAHPDTRKMPQQQRSTYRR